MNPTIVGPESAYHPAKGTKVPDAPLLDGFAPGEPVEVEVLVGAGP